MIVVHLAITTCAGYAEKRQPLRAAHVAQLEGWRAAGIVIGVGPALDATRADLVCRLQQPAQLQALWAEDQFAKAGLWTSYAARSFAEFVEPWQYPPADHSRLATIVEGPTGDRDMAQFALIELRGAGRLAFGGFFENGDLWALGKTDQAAQALQWFSETGFWAPDALRARPLLWVL